MYQSTWLHEEPIDDNEPIVVCNFRAEFNSGRISGWFRPYGFFKGFWSCASSTVAEWDACSWDPMSGRIQKITIGDAVSKDIKVTSSVPQRSHLGPLYFIWFVNRISEIFDYVRVLFYADDMKLFLPVSGFQDCLKIQSDLKKLSESCATEIHCFSTLVSVRI
jgi:hypothetical protein